MDAPLFNDPFQWFDTWYQDILASNLRDPNSMTVATVDATGMPHARTVLLKAHDERGFVFYTNLRSDKGKELEANPKASLLFYWKGPNQQIRIEGTIEYVSDEQADSYFASRPRGSQIGAWASEQSAILESRKALLDEHERLEELYKNQPVPRPPHWTGVRVIPQRFEFWQAGEFRLHDRFIFEKQNDDSWDIFRIAP